MAGGTARDRSSVTLLQRAPVFNGSATKTCSLPKESGQTQLGQTGQVREQRGWQDTESPPPSHPIFHEGFTPSPSSEQTITTSPDPVELSPSQIPSQKLVFVPKKQQFHVVALGTGGPSLLPWLAAVSSPQLQSSSWVLHPPLPGCSW